MENQVWQTEALHQPASTMPSLPGYLASPATMPSPAHADEQLIQKISPKTDSYTKSVMTF